MAKQDPNRSDKILYMKHFISLAKPSLRYGRETDPDHIREHMV